MKILLDEDSIGPFDVTAFVTFQLTPASDPNEAGTVITNWHFGPHFPGAVEDLITGELLDVIKVLAGRVVEYQVYQNPRGLEITARTLYPLRAQSKTSMETYILQKADLDSKLNALQELGAKSKGAVAAVSIPPRCSNGVCSKSPCNPPDNAVRCDLPGGPQCFQAEAPTAMKSTGDGKSGCC